MSGGVIVLVSLSAAAIGSACLLFAAGRGR